MKPRAVWLLPLALAGCTMYHAAPLSLKPPLQTSVAGLNRNLPDGTAVQLGMPLSARNVAALAVLNDPDLVAARAAHGVAQADLLSAGLLPDPVISGGFAALISGPGSAPSITGSLMQDVSALITYSANVRAAKAGVAQVDADILWQEWQVASAAEQLCILIQGDNETLDSLRADQNALTAVNTSTSNATASGNLTIAQSSSSLAALATTATALNNARQTLAQDQDALDALLDLQPGVVIDIKAGPVDQIDPALANEAIATLASRRPDLIALRYGYQQADARLRAAILTQFLPVTVGAAGGSDTSKVVSIGPQVSLTLPLFNRNRGGIASATATRAQLAAQFNASLASAQGSAAALLMEIGLLQSQSTAAAQAADVASGIAANAHTAFVNGNLDALSAVSLQTASADRRREAIALRVQLLTARLSLATLLGIGLPPVATTDLEPAQ
ncbi:TolC family protein [Acidocella aquatica]|nr:TolC family protein [Acidocella aquatica]